AGEGLTVEIDRRDWAGVASVEGRASIRVFVPVHPDRDPVEEADPRHAETLRAVADSAVRARAAARPPRRLSGSHNTRFGPPNPPLRFFRPSTPERSRGATVFSCRCHPWLAQ